MYSPFYFSLLKRKEKGQYIFYCDQILYLIEGLYNLLYNNNDEQFVKTVAAQ